MPPQEYCRSQPNKTDSRRFWDRNEITANFAAPIRGRVRIDIKASFQKSRLLRVG